MLIIPGINLSNTCGINTTEKTMIMIPFCSTKNGESDQPLLFPILAGLSLLHVVIMLVVPNIKSCIHLVTQIITSVPDTPISCLLYSSNLGLSGLLVPKSFVPLSGWVVNSRNFPASIHVTLVSIVIAVSVLNYSVVMSLLFWLVIPIYMPCYHVRSPRVRSLKSYPHRCKMSPYDVFHPALWPSLYKGLRLFPSKTAYTFSLALLMMAIILSHALNLIMMQKLGNAIVVGQGPSILSRLRIVHVMVHSFKLYPASKAQKISHQWWCGLLLQCYLLVRIYGMQWITLPFPFYLINGKDTSSLGSKSSAFSMNTSKKILNLHLFPLPPLLSWQMLLLYILVTIKSTSVTHHFLLGTWWIKWHFFSCNK